MNKKLAQMNYRIPPHLKDEFFALVPEGERAETLRKLIQREIDERKSETEIDNHDDSDSEDVLSHELGLATFSHDITDCRLSDELISTTDLIICVDDIGNFLARNAHMEAITERMNHSDKFTAIFLPDDDYSDEDLSFDRFVASMFISKKSKSSFILARTKEHTKLPCFCVLTDKFLYQSSYWQNSIVAADILTGFVWYDNGEQYSHYNCMKSAFKVLLKSEIAGNRNPFLKTRIDLSQRKRT